MPDAGCSVLDTRYSMLDARYWILNADGSLPIDFYYLPFALFKIENLVLRASGS
jgi:hypothetical protein